jgi:hypothetical protein
MNGVWKWKSGISLFPYYQGYDNMFCFSIKRANLKSAKKKKKSTGEYLDRIQCSYQ